MRHERSLPSRFELNTPKVLPSSTLPLCELEPYALITANAGGRHESFH